MKMKQHDIATLSLMPVDRIPEATCQLDNVIKQQPKHATMDKLVVIDMLREVLLSER
jgi:hypothetical protein